VLLVVMWSATGNLAPQRPSPAKGKKYGQFSQIARRYRFPSDRDHGLAQRAVARALSPVYARDGAIRIDELAERLGDLGFGATTPEELHKTVQQMKEEGLLEEYPLVPDGAPSGSGAEGYGLTLAGESYLHAWGDYLERYEKELGLFLRLYKGGQDAHTSPVTAGISGGREGRDGAGTVFVLTSSGLRHMGLRPGPPERLGERVSRLSSGGDLLERRPRAGPRRRPAPPLVSPLPGHGRAGCLGERRSPFPRRLGRLGPHGRVCAERTRGPHRSRHGTSRRKRSPDEREYIS
jgi:hypothetical protein